MIDQLVRGAGDGKPFDTSKYLVVCANVIGSCYGSTGPTSTNPDTGRPYLVDFPDVTIRDTVSVHMKMIKVGCWRCCAWLVDGIASFVNLGGLRRRALAQPAYDVSSVAQWAACKRSSGCCWARNL